MYDLVEEKEIMQRYDRKAVIEWFNNGGINQRA